METSSKTLLVTVFVVLTTFASQVLAGPVVQGKEWRDLNETTGLGLTWLDVSSVCDSETGVCDGRLTASIGAPVDISFTGWTWASLDDVNNLFNYYIGADELGPGPDEVRSYEQIWGPDFFADFEANNGSQRVEGFVRTRTDDLLGAHRGFAYSTDYDVQDCPADVDVTCVNGLYEGAYEVASTAFSPFELDSYQPAHGFWMYRSVDVPTPPAVYLFLLGSLVLVGLKRRSPTIRMLTRL